MEAINHILLKENRCIVGPQKASLLGHLVSQSYLRISALYPVTRIDQLGKHFMQYILQIDAFTYFVVNQTFPKEYPKKENRKYSLQFSKWRNIQRIFSLIFRNPSKQIHIIHSGHNDCGVLCKIFCPLLTVFGDQYLQYLVQYFSQSDLSTIGISTQSVEKYAERTFPLIF